MTRSSLYLSQDDVIPSGTQELPEDAPRVAVVVSLNFPGLTSQTLELMRRFTRTALQTLVDVGARPVLVDSSAPELPDPSVTGTADGVLVLGGGDIDSSLYGVEGPVPNEYGVDPRADVYTMQLIDQTLSRDAPMLAICRGSQLLNLTCGGTIIPDLDPWHLHRGGPGQPVFLDEDVTITPGSKLAGIFGSEQITVRSGHHQAVGKIAPSLTPSAVANDGIIEATEHQQATWVVGVQWHPEDDDGSAEDRRNLFTAFVEQVRSNKRGSFGASMARGR
ncbi:gamma-glutamyl-gamma-aminobutyrate hydrolase family protein [Arthrobacter sp. MDB2-24]